jgi:hypothetical protein
VNDRIRLTLDLADLVRHAGQVCASAFNTFKQKIGRLANKRCLLPEVIKKLVFAWE